MAYYRVFLSRHFIDVTSFEVEADTITKAKNKALRAANAKYSQKASRRRATDNSWHPDKPVVIKEPGSWAHGVHRVRKVSPGVFQIKGTK